MSDALSISWLTVDIAEAACARWGIEFTVQTGDDAMAVATLVRTSILDACRNVATFDVVPCYFDDFPGTVGDLPGMSMASVLEDLQTELSSEPVPEEADEWCVLVHVSGGERTFDIPLVHRVDKPTAMAILSVVDGAESLFIEVAAITEALQGHEFSLQPYVTSRNQLPQISANGSVPVDTSLYLRRAGVWDMLRAGVEARTATDLPAWSQENFEQRLEVSRFHDFGRIYEDAEAVAILASDPPEAGTANFEPWVQTISDLMLGIGPAEPMVGLSVLMVFKVKEPVEDGSWATVAMRNCIVACGLDPFGASQIAEFLREDAYGFFDLPDTEIKRFVFSEVTVVPDTTLWAIGASASGRIPETYDAIAASTWDDIVLT